MKVQIELPLADGSLLDIAKWTSDEIDTEGTSRTPLLLISDSDLIHEWDGFAEYASGRWDLHALWDVTAYQLVQVTWALGGPVAVCANGPTCGDVALRAQSTATGAIPLVALVDYTVEDDATELGRATGHVAIIRGRQSKRASHSDAVRARQYIGNGCELIEIEDCGDNAAMSCPAEFAAAISWLLYRD